MTPRARARFDGVRQRDALARFQKASGYEATEIAARVGLSYNQYLRYVWGKAPLRLDQVETFARAYGITPRTLTDAILPADEPGAILRERLHGRIQQDDLERLIREHGDAPPESQHAIADAALTMTAEEIEASRQTRRPA